ncbi:Helicase conserved C-terminal domain-containing protein [Devosia enhydra]|uniref:Helicase conserved C-terminal domain-containing protein n=1 Tax=Devosia enhydra TaxID=665118 RepID=A0A1K2HWN9_9HYPH|nr:SNF2-related protein [Devosia enhydra]SFZ83468.1 Helicase conserved C-terminal domain-containing protein [Devosia enhydra]
MIAYSLLQGHYLAHHLTLAGSGDESLTRSLAAARVDMNPHQVDASLFALRSPLSKGVLLADEVGLGKTIEAGLVIAQRWAEQRRRILLIVPASLRKQWQQELAEKFSLESTIVEASTYKDLKANGHARPFAALRGVVISSYEFAARKAEELKKITWDVVVIDEAHRLRNVYKKGSSMRAKELREALDGRFKVLLTATPLQNSLMELYGLVSVIDDDHFGGEDSFRTLYAGARSNPASLEALRERLLPICHRTLRKQVQQAGHINFTRRHAKTFSFEPDANEVLLYQSVSSFLQSGTSVAYGDKPNQLVHLQVMKILGSSTFAVSKYLEKVIERLQVKQRSIGIDVSDDLDAFNELADEFDNEDEEEEEVDPEKLKREILELNEYLKLARSIGSNAKGQALLNKLPSVLDEIIARGGARKAVIFTESVRTQTYLNDLLVKNGYAGQTVLLNGSNTDPLSKQIYEEWKARHPDKAERSGSKSADMKAAIVEAFKSDDKTILIATESGAEGINLQFCSLVINYDLPWNPQRIEQRIGRCHRYGQKIDVVVVNMLNLKNQAEQRIYELLSQKFQLFDGVFGSSDEVLGTIERGIDFERTVLEILQRCRTDDDIKREFDELTESLKSKIDDDIKSTRAKVLENLDQDVVSRLKDRQGSVQQAIGDYTRRLLLAARAELPGAVFDEPGAIRFRHDGKTYTTMWPDADDRGWEFFRLADGNLATQMLEGARQRDHKGEAAALTLSPSLYPFPGQLADVANLRGQSGWLQVSRVTVTRNGAPKDTILLSCLTDSGELVEPATADRLLMVPVVAESVASLPGDRSRLGIVEEEHLEEFKRRINEENARWLDEEESRLDNYARDLEVELDAQIAALEEEIKEMQRRRRSPELGMEEKLKLGRDIKRREGAMDDLKLSKFEKRRAIRRQVGDMMDEIAESLTVRPVTTHLFTMRWSVV